MKLWNKGFDIDKQVEKFTIGKDSELDMQLAEYDVQGSAAHVQMLCSIGILTGDEEKILLAGLADIAQEIRDGKFVIEAGTEDVHSQVETLLTQRLGDVGKKIHTGRSRNDQVLVDIKLFVRAKIKEIAAQTQTLFDTFIALSQEHKNVLLPGYTHLQMAMPSSFGLWFAAYAETLVDDVQILAAAYKVANQNPLGSGAGYGSSFPLNRAETTRLLGFETMHYNVAAAQMSRGKTERAFAFGIAGIAATLARFAMDVCLYNSQNFGFITLPDAFTTGSSIMPHKKNPDVMELVRGKCNRLQSLPNEIALLCTNLPSGYHREFQLLKEILFPAITELSNCLQMTTFVLQHINIQHNILSDERYNCLFTVESVNALVQDGVPFREAYRQVGAQVQQGTYQPLKALHHTHEGSIGNLCNAAIAGKMQHVMDTIIN
ncbi:argininosuccinate lyase [Bacteroidia bacterium]|nr:argininosuccinate lyase [Bacteroidia bacterium]